MTRQFFARMATAAMIFAAGLLGTVATAQNRAISGTVADASGAPVVGAAVVVVGNTSIGAVTNVDGTFRLNVPAGANIEVSCIGYAPQVIPVGNQSVFNVVLQEDTEFLDETVVIGYGVQKKSDLTGSVASVRADDLQNRSTSDAAIALQGKAAGVQVVRSSGAPGKGADIRVRGYSSNSGNIGPLLIVDGLQVDNIQYLDPEMIESMEILKDAASAAIYGAQAGNGVVLITTKSGKKGEGRIFYNGQFTLSSLSRKLDIMNAADYIDFEKACGYLSDQALTDAHYDGLDVDWSKEIFVPTWSNRHTVGFSGGNDRGNLFVSLNNVKDNGIVRGDKDVYNRLTFQVNADYKIKDWLTIGVNNSIERWSTRSVSEANDNGSFLLSAITSSPLFPVSGDRALLEKYYGNMIDYENKGYNLITDPDTGLYWLAPRIGSTQSGHPFIQRDATDSSNGGFSIRGVAFANFMPFKGFTFTSRFGYRISQSNSHSYSAPYYSSNTVKSDNYSISASANNGWYYQWENFANYNRAFGRHEIGVMAGMSYIENNWDNVSGSASGTDILKGYTPNFRYLDFLLTDGVSKTMNNAPGRSASLSYFGRLTYSFDDRYSIQANFRADAFDSSKLPLDKKWGYFPSVSAGWTISNEPFFKNNVDTNVFNFLKLRASWGINGNINVLNNYPYTSAIMANAVYYQYDPDSPTLSLGSIPSGLGNPNLKWETSVQADFGLDARLFNNRLTVGIDLFNKDTKDLLVGVSPVKEVGLPAFGDLGVATTVTMNAGSVNNKGIELELGWRDQLGDFGYSLNGNISWLKNMVTYVDPTVGQITGRVPQGCEMGTYFEEGHSVWYLLGYKAVGFDNEGNALYQAADGSETASPSQSDRVDLGSGIPNLLYGLTASFTYKNFDLTIFGNGTAGSKIFPTSWRPDRKECNTYSYYWANSWDNPAVGAANAKFPAADKWSTQSFSSSLTLFDGSYFKIKQIQLGYTLPKQLTQKVKINHLRAFISFDNFFTFSKYIGLDPETATNGGSAAGIDMGNYPTAKSMVLGVNLEF